MAVIAMTREMATRGKDVAAGLAERLGLDIVHHELVEHDIAERAGMPESEVHRYLEGEATLFERWKIGRERLSRYTAQEILELAINGNVLIRGWGAAYLLRTVPHVVCARICAPMSYREMELMKRLAIDDAAVARREIERSDAAHNLTMQKLFGTGWRDASHYAIILNTSRVPIDECIELIVKLTESTAFRETGQSRIELADKVVEFRIRAALEQRFGSVGASLGIDIAVSDGKVSLTGATTDETMIVETVRLVQGIDGVKRVESKIAHLGFHA